MSETLKIRDLGKLAIIVCGVPMTGGFGTDDVIKIERTSPTFTTKIGADGSVVRSKTYNGHAKITLSLLQTSSANAILSTIHAVALASDNGADVAPFSVVDTSGATLIAAAHSWIASPPDATFGREVNNNEWIVEVSDLVEFHGGN